MNEVGAAMCRLPNGKIIYGPMVEGTPTSVSVPMRCPPNSNLMGIFPTHPGGIPEPSETDIRSGLNIRKVETLCIHVPETGVTKCHNIRKGR